MFNKNIEHSTLEFVLDHAILNRTEDRIFQFCMAWAKEKLTKQHKEDTPLNIRDVLGPCLFKIQFQNFTTETFTKLVPKEGLLDDKTTAQFYRCIALGNELQDSDFPSGFEWKERINESTHIATIRAVDKMTPSHDYSKKSKIKFPVDEAKTVSILDLKMFRCHCVNRKDTRNFDSFFSDAEESVKINGVACLDTIIYDQLEADSLSSDEDSLDFDPQVINVGLHLTPQEVRGQCVIDIDLKPRNEDSFSFECVGKHSVLVDEMSIRDDETEIQIYDTDLSPINSITYHVAE